MQNSVFQIFRKISRRFLNYVLTFLIIDVSEFPLRDNKNNHARSTEAMGFVSFSLFSNSFVISHFTVMSKLSERTRSIARRNELSSDRIRGSMIRRDSAQFSFSP